jgi:hypothetical protein
MCRRVLEFTQIRLAPFVSLGEIAHETKRTATHRPIERALEVTTRDTPEDKPARYSMGDSPSCQQAVSQHGRIVQ